MNEFFEVRSQRYVQYHGSTLARFTGNVNL
jgi:hypothetical protein